MEKIVTSSGLIPPEQFESIRDEFFEDPFAVLDRLGIGHKAFINIVSRRTGIEYIPPEQVHIDEKTKKLIPEAVAREHFLVPEKADDETITIIMGNPADMDAITRVEFLTGRQVKAFWSNPKFVQSLIDELYNPQKSLEDIISRLIGSAGEEDEIDEAPSSFETEQELSPDLEKPVVKVVNIILADAISRGASDIHIEPTENACKVRFRIDGDLHEILTLPKKIHPSIVSRIKVLAKLDIAIKRAPQDGKMRVRFKGETIDMRVSTLPSNYGEKVVIRILDPSMTKLSLSDLGFPPDVEKKFKEAISRTQGMVIVTGPTGSGKSTTLYSALNWVKSPKLNIITVEDPIEYQLEGITQVQVNPKAGLDFAAALKSILRQDPDIVLIGEIRDQETVQIAIRAALTGHLVLSTLHTNDAPSAVTRIEDMGVPRYLISSSLTAVLAQRLVKRVCPKCKHEVKPEDLGDEDIVKFARKYGIEKLWVGSGCDYCRFTGHKGRIGIYELFFVDTEIAQMIADGATDIELKKFAVEKKGMRTLFADALEKVKAGITSIYEMRRVVGLEDPLEALKAAEEQPAESAAPKTSAEPETPPATQPAEPTIPPAQVPSQPEPQIPSQPPQPMSPPQPAPAVPNYPPAQPTPAQPPQAPGTPGGTFAPGQTFPPGGTFPPTPQPAYPQQANYTGYSVSAPVFGAPEPPERIIAPTPNLVLTIDDDPMIRRMVRALLEPEGFTVIEAENGAQGLEMAYRYRPALILLDIRMPVLDGYQTLAALRSKIEFSNIAVIMLTAESEEENELKALEMGADDFIRKPFRPQKLMARIKAVLRRAQMEHKITV